MNKLKIIKWIMSFDFDCLKKHFINNKFVYITSSIIIALALILCRVFDIAIDDIWETIERVASWAKIGD